MEDKPQALCRRASLAWLMGSWIGVGTAKAGSGRAQREQDGGETLRLPLRIQVARCPGQQEPVRPASWVNEHVEAANALFAAHQIELSAKHTVFAAKRCNLVTRQHRDEVSVQLEVTSEVPVVVVERVVDLDVPTYDLMGVHWRANAAAARGRDRFVLLTSRAKPPVLAHELCHFFGLSHDVRGGNLMTPGPSSPAWSTANPPQPFKPLLTATQATALRRAVRLWLRR